MNDINIADYELVESIDREDLCLGCDLSSGIGCAIPRGYNGTFCAEGHKHWKLKKNLIGQLASGSELSGETETTASTTISRGAKHDAGKLRYSLIPTSALTAIAKVLEFGAKKYGANTWQNVPDAEGRYYDAAIRHLLAHKSGEKNDTESGLSHLSHAACNLCFLVFFEEKNGADNE